MSMILDALTRAEQERQIEKQPNLKFVTPVRKHRKKSKNAWIWITAALTANAVILAVFLNPTISQYWQTQSTPKDTEAEKMHVSRSDVQPESVLLSQNLDLENVVSKSNKLTKQNTEIEARPLAMELEEPAVAQISAKGSVSFSEEELSINEFEQPITNAPKLLIDQGDGEFTPQTNSVPKLKDLPLSSRNSLSKFEVNVHVYDDNPQNRFVLINMDKYKEGDHVVNNGPFIEKITRDGVVVDYGSGKALLPPK